MKVSKYYYKMEKKNELINLWENYLANRKKEKVEKIEKN